MRRRISPLVFFLFASLAACAPTPDAADSRPDAVFLIVVDTLRPDRLSCYGYEKHRTPNIDELAESGVLFRNAQSVASWTIPSMGAMLTSLYPSQLGLVERPAEAGRRFEWRELREQLEPTLAPDATTLAEILQHAGFHTAAFVDQPGLDVGDGFSQGFAEWFHPVAPSEIHRRLPGEPLPAKKWPTLLLRAASTDSALVREFEAWLPRNSDRKHFVWIHLLTPHRPYGSTRQAVFGMGQPASTPSSRYDAEIRLADGLVGDIVRAIRKNVGDDRALIVFTSDHGEAFGEHGMREHGHSLHREVIHVPLVICAPSLPAGSTHDGYVPTTDLLPTILDLLGESGAVPETAEGTSLVPELATGGADRPVFSEAVLYGSTERSLVDGGHKLMYDEDGERFALYDVTADPGETTDLAGTATGEPELERMRASLREKHAEHPRTHDRRATSVEADEARRAMESLGYIE